MKHRKTQDLRKTSLGLIALLAAAMAPAALAAPLYQAAPADHLPGGGLLKGMNMDAGIADLDADGDLDILIASEYRANILLINDGKGRFTDGSDRLPQVSRDSEDVAIADFDRDGALDAVIVSEDDKINDYYRNTGGGRFEDAGADLPVQGVTNGVIAGDVDGDGDMDLVLANNGQNILVLNDGEGRFRDVTADQLPAVEDVTQDVALGDVDNDGDLDLLFGNEGQNRLLINDGAGRFSDVPDALPVRAQESREADFGDVDGDGDLDILVANVRFFMDNADRQNRLLINDGAGRFQDGGARLPEDDDNAAEGDLIDLDGDGDLDIVTTNVLAIRGAGMGRLRAYLNEGGGIFEDQTEAVFPAEAVGNGFDAAQGDVNGDGLADLFIANRIGPDLLLLRRP
ncbi:MAG: FG-GAP repeat domain-containing protein [Alphaproteobacteria bacterium]